MPEEISGNAQVRKVWLSRLTHGVVVQNRLALSALFPPEIAKTEEANMKRTTTFVAACLLAAPAFAFSGTTSNFDGVYLGAVHTSAGNCPAFEIGRVTISNGALKSDTGEAAISGIITQEGYVAATLSRNGTTARMDGRLDNGMISAGYMDGACAWIVELRPAT